MDDRMMPLALSVAFRFALRTARIAAFAAAVTIALPTVTVAAGPRDDDPLVVILSWDGLRHDFPDRAEFPAMQRMARQGVRVERLIPPWPSNTFPGHVTLATGAPTSVHGIVDNHFYDRERGYYRYAADADWIDAEPLWIAAERQGVRAATYFWVGSESDWRGQRATYRHEPFDPRRPEADKVDQIIAWIDLPATERPGLIMSYWRGADRAGHNLGPEHSQIVAELTDQDRELARLQAAIDARDLWPVTTLMVVSDHGMTEVREFFDLAGHLEELGIGARMAGGATVKHVFLEEPMRAAEVAQSLQNQAKVRAWARHDLPADITLAYPARTGDVVVVAEPPLILEQPSWTVRAFFQAMRIVDGRVPGTHGYDPEHPDMAGAMLALGRGVGRGKRIARMHMMDVAPTAARLLGIEPPRDAQGRAIPALSHVDESGGSRRGGPRTRRHDGR